MKLLFKYLSLHLQTQLQYKMSFFFSSIAQFLSTYIDYIAVYALFEKFGVLKEYNIYEVMLTFGITYASFSLTEMLGRGFDLFENLIKYGSFDILLIRPRSLWLQIIGSEIAYQKASRILNGLIVLIIAIINLHIPMTLINIFLIISMIISSSVIFMAIMIMGAAFCFVTIQGLEVVNIFTYGIRQFAQYPINVYGKHLLRFFTFGIPIALANYYPLSYLINHTNNYLYIFYPLLGMLFIIPAIFVFNLGLKKYHSTGS